MIYSPPADLLHSHSWVTKCFYTIGFVDGLSCMLLIIGAAIGLFLKPLPRQYATTVEILAIILLVTSSIVMGAYVVELWVMLFGGNRYERFAFFHARGGQMPVMVWYSLRLVYMLLPQLFWHSRIRGSMLAVLLIAVGASLPQWFDRWVWTM